MSGALSGRWAGMDHCLPLSPREHSTSLSGHTASKQMSILSSNLHGRTSACSSVGSGAPKNVALVDDIYKFQVSTARWPPDKLI